MAKRKTNSKLTSVIVIAIILLFAAVVTFFCNSKGFFKDGKNDNQPIDSKMYVNFVDVGQGDCTLITCNGKTILVDVGETGESQTVINYIKNQGIKKLDCVIGTHPHSDHIGCMGYVLNAFDVGDVIMPEIPDKIMPTTVCFEKFLDAVEEKAENAYFAEVGDEYTYGDMKFQILAPVKNYDDLNNMSVVVKLTFGSTSVMLTGDAEKKSEKDMLKNNINYSADILKMGHHGSRTSSTDEWLNAVNPTYAVISCGKNNDYGHPHKETISKLKKHNIEYLRTDLLGDIVFVSDGKSFTKVVEN